MTYYQNPALTHTTQYITRKRTPVHDMITASNRGILKRHNEYANNPISKLAMAA